MEKKPWASNGGLLRPGYAADSLLLQQSTLTASGFWARALGGAGFITVLEDFVWILDTSLLFGWLVNVG